MIYIVQLLIIDFIKYFMSALLNDNKIKIFNINNKLKELNSTIIFENMIKKRYVDNIII